MKFKLTRRREKRGRPFQAGREFFYRPSLLPPATTALHLKFFPNKIVKQRNFNFSKSKKGRLNELSAVQAFGWVRLPSSVFEWGKRRPIENSEPCKTLHITLEHFLSFLPFTSYSFPTIGYFKDISKKKI